MKKNVLVFGLISGLIVTTMMVITTSMLHNNSNYKADEVLGYTTMIIAFAFVFVGIKNVRDKYNGGVISFGKAFRTGLYITLIASTMYVGVWLIEYYVFYPDFMDKFMECYLKDAKASGASAAELQKKTDDMAGYIEMYKTPIGVILITYMEILPVGLIVTLISALVLKRKTARVAV